MASPPDASRSQADDDFYELMRRAADSLEEHPWDLHIKAEPVRMTWDTEDSSPETWVKCDKCGKWRRADLSPGDLGLVWHCEDTPNPRYASCHAPQELAPAQINQMLRLKYAGVPKGVVEEKLPGPVATFDDSPFAIAEAGNERAPYKAAKAVQEPPLPTLCLPERKAARQLHPTQSSSSSC